MLRVLRQRAVRNSVIAAVVLLVSALWAPIAGAYNSAALGDNPNGGHGGSANLCVNKLWVWTGHISGHVNNSIWVYFDPNGDYAHWTEAGMINGVAHTFNTNGNRIFYWADDSGQYGYSEHPQSDGPALGSSYLAQVSYSNPPWWYVSIGNDFSFGSYHNVSNTYRLSSGLEFDSTNTGYEQETGSSWDMSWLNPSNNLWVKGWNYPSSTVDSPAGGYWYEPYHYWKDELGQSWSC